MKNLVKSNLYPEDNIQNKSPQLLNFINNSMLPLHNNHNQVSLLIEALLNVQDSNTIISQSNLEIAKTVFDLNLLPTEQHTNLVKLLDHPWFRSLESIYDSQLLFYMSAKKDLKFVKTNVSLTKNTETVLPISEFQDCTEQANHSIKVFAEIVVSKNAPFSTMKNAVSLLYRLEICEDFIKLFPSFDNVGNFAKSLMQVIVFDMKCHQSKALLNSTENNNNTNYFAANFVSKMPIELSMEMFKLYKTQTNITNYQDVESYIDGITGLKSLKQKPCNTIEVQNLEDKFDFENVIKVLMQKDEWHLCGKLLDSVDLSVQLKQNLLLYALKNNHIWATEKLISTGASLAELRDFAIDNFDASLLQEIVRLEDQLNNNNPNFHTEEIQFQNNWNYVDPMGMEQHESI